MIRSRSLLLGLGGCLALAVVGARADDGVLLRYRLHPGDEFRYSRTAKITATLNLGRAPGSAVVPGAASPPVRLLIDVQGQTQRRVAGTLPDGSFRVFDRHVVRASMNGRPLPIPAIGPTETRLSPLGARRSPAGGAFADLTPFGINLPDLLPGAFVQFPPDAVPVGARWRTQAEVSLPGDRRAVLVAASRLASMETCLDQPCARIITEVTIPALDLLDAPGGGAGDLRLRGTATGEAVHALSSGMPLRSHLVVHLWLEARGATPDGQTPPTGAGEVEAVLDEQWLPGAAPADPPVTAVRPTASQSGQGLRIIQPEAAQRSRGAIAVACEVSAADARYALIRIDGVARAAMNAPYQHRLDLTGIAPGAHTLEVILYGYAGVPLASARRQIRVE